MLGSRAFFEYLENNKFTSIIQVRHATRDLFKSKQAKENFTLYNVNKVTHSTQLIKKVRVVTRKCIIQNDTSDSEVLLRERAMEKIENKSTVDIIAAHLAKNADQIKFINLSTYVEIQLFRS